jgi:peptide-methionine (S)-S-oxide reductase
MTRADDRSRLLPASRELPGSVSLRVAIATATATATATALALAIALAVALPAGSLLAVEGPAPPAASAAPSGRALALEKAVFAGGCFWCMEPPFEKLRGVVKVTSGYTGGTVERPTYEEVSSGTTGHAEAIEVLFDPAQVTYETLLGTFWHNVDPTAKDRQFCDAGRQYRSAIFTRGEAQRRAALESRRALEAGKPFTGAIVTEIVDAGPFWPAEEYHQGYWRKNPVRYRFYRSRCGRDDRLAELWGEKAGK